MGVETISYTGTMGDEVKGVVELERASQASPEQQPHQSTWQVVVQYKTAVIWSAFMGLGAINWGLDVLLANGVISVPSFQEDFGYLYEGDYIISSGWQIAFNTASSIGGFFGAVGAGYMADWVGKKKTLWAACIISVIAVFIQIFAFQSGVLMAGKLINGLTLGAFLTVPSSYASEVCPVEVRGLTTSGVQLFICIGQLMANCILKGTGTLSSSAAYKIPFTLQFVFPFFIMIGLYFSPESPWFLARQNKTSEAFAVLTKLGYPCPTSTLAEISKTIALDEEKTKTTSYLECFRGSALRRTEIAMGITCVAQLTGVVFVIGYSSYFFELAGLSTSNSFTASVGVSILSLIGVLCSWFLINRVGRRSMALGGTAALAILCLLIGILDVLPSNGTSNLGPVYGQVACIILFAFIYLLTIGPVGYALFAEISSPKLRSRTVGLGIVVQNMFGVVMNIVVPLMINPDAANMNGKIGFIFAGTAGVSVIWVYFRVPETSHRSFEELDCLFERRVPARGFKGCVVSG